MAKKQLELKWLDPKDLKENPANWRRHGEQQQQALQEALDRVGWAGVALLNEATGQLIDGHLRRQEAIRRGELLPVLVGSWTQEEERYILATLDPMTAMAEADEARLRALLDAGGPIAAEPGGQPDQGPVDLGEAPAPLDDAPPPVRAPARASLGQLFQLGPHRLLCGDTMKPADVRTLMNGKKAAMVFLDPPYAMYGSSTGVTLEIADDKMIRPFFRNIVAAAVENSKLFAHIYICCDWRSWAAWSDVARELRCPMKNCIVWDKGAGGLGAMYQQCHEFIAFFTNSPTRTKVMDKRTGEHLIQGRSNVWHFPRVTGSERLHNAAKPLELVKEAIKASSEPGDLVLDLFGGSGTVMMAAEELGRTCYTMEVDPHWVDVTLERWKRFKGE